MKKKLGIIEVRDLESKNLIKEINIWGTLFKGDSGKLIGGIYFTLKPEEMSIYWPLIHRVMQKTSISKISYHEEFYGSYYNIGMYGTENTNFDGYLKILKMYINVVMTAKYSFKVKIDKDFQYVVDANIVEKI